MKSAVSETIRIPDSSLLWNRARDRDNAPTRRRPANVRFPLTPALPLWDRGNGRQSFDIFWHNCSAEALGRALHLPKGECRGEGEQTARLLRLIGASNPPCKGAGRNFRALSCPVTRSPNVFRVHLSRLRHLAGCADYWPRVSARVPGQPQEPSHTAIGLCGDRADQVGN